jgi:hypothetical protein
MAESEVSPILLLKVFQSVEERAPVVVEFAVRIPNTPVRLLYVSGHTAESAVSPILVATVEEREAREPDMLVTLLLVVVREPEREAREPDMLVTLLLVVVREPEREAREPERVDILVVCPSTTPERVVRLVLVVSREPERVFTCPERVVMFPVAVARLELMVAIEPVIAEMVHERAVCALVLVK